VSRIGTLATTTPWGVILVFSAPLLLPVGRAVEAPVLLMALLGVVLLVKHGRFWWRQARVRLFCAAFLASWIPMALSLPDAVNFTKTGIVVLNHLRFLFAGLFMLHVLYENAARALLLRLLGWLLAFWVLDAVVQYFLGVDVFGFKAFPGRLSAVFGSGNSKFGLTVAVFAPALWEYARRRFGLWTAAVVVVITLAVVLESGSRAAWIASAAAVGLYVCALGFWTKILELRALAVILLLLVAFGAAGYFVSDKVAGGVDAAAQAFSGDVDETKNTVSHRVWIWKGAWSMFVHNPVNGVGARGFRHAFQSYARPDDPFLKEVPPIVPTHSHQLLIELATETGSLGLLGLLLTLTLLARAALKAPLEERISMLPFGVAVGAAFFPFNSHLAIYSAYWSQIVWFLITLYCASVGASEASADDRA
jgi:O-antigen ligase